MRVPVAADAGPFPHALEASAQAHDVVDPLDGGAAAVRIVQRQDIPQIRDLFAATFRAGRRGVRDDLETCLAETYLTSPQDRDGPASLVDVTASGQVNGFMGIITLGARLDDQRLRGSILGSFMAAGPDRAKTALRLMRATLAQDVDFIFSDTANRTSLDLARAQKFSVLPLHSLEWVRVFRPCGTASFMLARRRRRLGRAMSALARVADVGASRFAPVPAAGDLGVVARAVTPEEFAAQVPAFLRRFRLKPDWPSDDLPWLLDQAVQKTRNGPLAFRAVHDRGGKTLGLYLLYARAGAVAHALQLFALRGREAEVLGCLIREAYEVGALAVRGSAAAGGTEGLIRQPGILYHHPGASVVFARDPIVRAAFRGEDALVGGLLGETWSRLVAEEFA